jgi:4-amino-4-deoxy-L-arabinose transferase-like glycosyltransferase
MILGARAIGSLRRNWTAGLAILLGGGLAFVLMANDGQVRHGALIGGLGLLASIAGLLRVLGLLAARQDAIALPQDALHAQAGEPRWAAPRLAVPAALVALLAIVALFGAAGVPFAIAAALLLLLPAALRRPGLLLFVVVSALYLPLLGTFGLWDPWETHYGEVAREMLARDDWISLWWAQDKWFWSKPIFIFWVEALFWSASGIPFAPDSNFDHAEWVLRLPTYVISIAALMAVYAAISRLWSRRAALLGGLVLATTPYYALLTHQAITDLPFVGTMTIAVMLLLLAVHEEPEREVRSYRIGRFSVSAQEIVIGAFLLLALPQALYLASRNITFVGGLFAWHPDEFMFGSGGNPDVPGNFGIRNEAPRFRAFYVQPLAQALLWGAGIVFVVRALRRERRAQALYMMAFYLLCALSFMAKGVPGFALPGLIALLYLWACNRWSLLLEGRLKIALGAAALFTVGLPWFVAMYVRHGAGFTNRLFVHDHLNRLTKGVHGDTGAIEYFAEQLGYGLFPWIALAPLALGSWLLLARDPGSDPDAQRRRDSAVLIGLWFASAFTLYSAMITKFHHYILPAVPPAAILIGGLLDRMLGEPSEAQRAQPLMRKLPVASLALLAPVPLVLGVAGLRGDPRGMLPAGLPTSQQSVWVLQNAWPPWACGGLIALGLVCLGAAAFLDLRGRGDLPARPDERALGAGLLAGALLCAFVGRDLSWTTAKRPAGHERLIDLFVYNYERPWPAHIDYRPILSGFAVVAVVLVGLAALRALRPVLTHAIVGLAVAFTVFAVDVYMIDLTPHWSQRALIKRYYRERKSAKDPLVAWQMNWKGENFYSGNRVAVFVNLNNKEITNWLDDNAGKTAYFLLEHSRLARFKTMVGKRKVHELTTVRDNNKFILVRVGL